MLFGVFTVAGWRLPTDAATWIGWLAGQGTVLAILLGIVRFRLKSTARIDERRQAIVLDIANRGRASGVIDKVAVVDNQTREIPADFEGFEACKFIPVELRGRASLSLVIKAPRAHGAFPEGLRILVRTADGRKSTLELATASGVSFYGERSKGLRLRYLCDRRLS